jgi:hypothetical protein
MDVLTPRELEAWIVRPSGLALMQPLDRSLSADSWANVTVQGGPGGAVLEPASGEYYPHVLVRIDRSTFTSVALALKKPGG